MSLRRTLFGLAILALPTAAVAGDTVVVSPLLSKGVDAMVVMNITSLMTSELDFMGNVDGVVELPKAPDKSSCLDSTSCLSGLASDGGGNKVVAGTITASGEEFVLDLVLYDKGRGRVERRKEFRLDSSPEAVADGMTAVLKELYTGVAPAAEAAEEPALADFTASADDGDDFDFEDDLSDFDPEEEARLDAERKRAEEEERRRREEEERRRLEEERKRKEAEERARREEEERARREEEERRRREEEERRRAAAQPEPEPEFDPTAISFGDASSEITAEEVEQAIQFGSASPAPAPAPRPRPAPIEDPDEEDRRARASSGGMEDLDGGKSNVDRDPAMFTLAVRAGGAKYYGLTFVTGGGEISVAAGDSGVAIVAGMEMYGANRTVPVELQQTYGRTQEWNFIYPVNAGVIYRLDNGGLAVPYLGADLIGASYFVDPPTTVGDTGVEIEGKRHNTIGARARLGVDLMFIDNVGLNINAAIGGWSGKRWPIVDPSAKAGGLLPQISAGAVAAF